MSKQIFITGSTDGIGKLAAIHLAQEGHSIYLHGRNQQKLSDSIIEVKEQSGSRNVKGFLADFSDLKAVKKMSEEVKAELTHIDALINNAGVYKSQRSMVMGGLDIRFVVNYLAPYLLTKELFPLLDKAEKSRIINLGSAAQAPVNLSDLQNGEGLSDQSAYAQSKLALTMWTFHQARSRKGVSAIVVNPGSLLDTKMVQEAFGQVWAPAEKGAEILKELAISEKYDEISGAYFDNDKGGLGQAHPEAYDTGKTEDLMRVTEKLIGQYIQIT